MQKYYLLFILCICFMLTLSGCGKSLEEQTKQKETKIKVNSTNVDYSKFFEVDKESGISVVVKDDSKIDIGKIGTYPITILLQKDEKVEEVSYNIEVYDDEAPVLKRNKKEIIINQGDAIDSLKYVKVSDNSGESIKPEVDDSGVNINKKGKYTIKYTATDASGNSSNLDVPVTVLKDYSYKEMKKICKKLLKQKKYKGLTVYYNKKYKYIGVSVPSIGDTNWSFHPFSYGRAFIYCVDCVISKKNYGDKNKSNKYMKSDLIAYGYNVGAMEGSSYPKKYIFTSNGKKISLSNKFAEQLEKKVFNWQVKSDYTSASARAFSFESESQINDFRKMIKAGKVKIATKVASGSGDSRTLSKSERKSIMKVLMFYKELNEKYIYNIEK